MGGLLRQENPRQPHESAHPRRPLCSVHVAHDEEGVAVVRQAPIAKARELRRPANHRGMSVHSKRLNMLINYRTTYSRNRPATIHMKSLLHMYWQRLWSLAERRSRTHQNDSAPSQGAPMLTIQGGRGLLSRLSLVRLSFCSNVCTQYAAQR